MEPIATASPAPPETWAPARRAARALASPLQRIFAVEAASGIVLLVATVIALVWASSAWSASYRALWETPVGFQLGSWAFVHPLRFWIDEGAMTLFFFVVGLEIRREMFEGELATLRGAAMPLAAALGGMALPAVIYAVLNAGRAGAAGWAIPMATDIAFALGAIVLLGSRVPASLRILLLSLAVIDDIGAIIVIAVFYSGGVALSGFVLAAIGMAIVFALRGAAVRSPLAYVVPGVVVWIGLAHAGVHPTLAGVLLGLATPVRAWFGAAGFSEATRGHLDDLPDGDRAHVLHRLDQIEHARREAVSPADRLVHVLHPWIAFGVMPVFALANAGIALGAADLDGGGAWVFAGIVLGLGVGKPLGIAGSILALGKLGLLEPAHRARWLVLVGSAGGIGFTMSLFIAQLAFPPGPLLEAAKLAILVGSALAIAGTLALGFTLGRTPRGERAAART